MVVVSSEDRKTIVLAGLRATFRIVHGGALRGIVGLLASSFHMDSVATFVFCSLFLSMRYDPESAPMFALRLATQVRPSSFLNAAVIVTTS